MTISLACSGWIMDAPAGNRLRWRADACSKIEIQRAPLKPWTSTPSSLGPALVELAPFDWWTPLGAVPITGSPCATWTAATPVQAVCFAFSGPDAVCLVLDPFARRIARVAVSEGGNYSFTGALISELRFLTPNAALVDLHTLDLTVHRDLPWQPIATVPQLAPKDLPTALTRLPDGVLQDGVVPEGATFDDDVWAGLRLLSTGSFPDGVPIDDRFPGPGGVADLLGSSQFWMAVLAGTGFIDGPRTVDDLVDSIVPGAGLNGPQPVAYRVLDAATGQASNLAVSSGRPVPGLPTPTGVSLTAASVRMADSGGNLGATLVSTSELAGWPMLGRLYERHYSASPATGAPASDEASEHRGLGREGTTPEPLSCTDPVASWDLTASVRYAAFDGWDRVSEFSPWSAPRPLDVHHFPVGPWFAVATQTSSGVRLTPAKPAWAPDAFVARLNSRVVIRRRIATSPAVRAATIGSALSRDDASVHVTLDPSLEATEMDTFSGGTLVVAGRTYPILALDADGASLLIVRGYSGAANLPAPGPAMLHQSNSHPNLWVEVADLPAIPLPPSVDIVDPWAPGETSRVYAASVDFDPGAGREASTGPIGPSVHCLAWQQRPDPPPPITARVLVSEPTGRSDVDTYGRLLVEVTFAAAAPDGDLYTVWWCEGGPERFQAARSAGVSGPQPALSGLKLFDALALPVPIPALVTIGVTHVTGGHVHSDAALTTLGGR